MRISDWSSDVCSSDLLLVSLELDELGQEPFGFFDFTVPGLVLAACGLLYLFFVAPRLLPDRAPAAGGPEEGKSHFVAQIAITQDSRLAGLMPVGGIFPDLKDITVLMILRGEQSFVPPYEELPLAAGDLVIVAATRQALAGRAHV